MALLKVASWDEVGGDWNATETETSYLHHIIRHEFNEPASAVVRIADPTGAKMQKYNVDTGAIFIGPGKVWIEDPDTVNLFYGRIMRATYDYENSQVVLYCEDWMSQTKDESISYDLRENLRNNSWEGYVKESKLQSDLTYNDVPVWSAGGNYDIIDAQSPWSADYWNGKFVVIPDDGTGNILTTTGPYGELVDPENNPTIDIDTPTEGENNVWEYDWDTHYMHDNDEGWNVYYYYYLPHITGSLLETINAVKLKYNLIYSSVSGGTQQQSDSCTISVWNWTTFVWDVITILYPSSNWQDGEYSFNLTNLVDDYVNSTTGYLWIQFDCPNPNNREMTLAVNIAVIESSIKLYEMTDALTITDTIRGIDDGGAVYNTLRVNTNCAEDGLGLYEGCPYSIVDYLYTHINVLITAADDAGAGEPAVTLDTSVETTSTISCRRFEEKTTHYIVNELAKEDNAVFYVVLGDTSPTVIYKKTFNGAGTAFDDDDVLKWDATDYDASSIWNEVHIYLGEIARRDFGFNEQMMIDSSEFAPDPGADSKDIYGVRSTVISGGGITSRITGNEYAENFVDRYKDMKLFLNATIAGLSSYRLGDELKITSTELNLTNEVYVITAWEYNSEDYRTRITLHPQSVVGYLKIQNLGSTIGAAINLTKELSQETSIKRPGTVFGE